MSLYIYHFDSVPSSAKIIANKPFFFLYVNSLTQALNYLRNNFYVNPKTKPTYFPSCTRNSGSKRDMVKEGRKQLQKECITEFSIV